MVLRTIGLYAARSRIAAHQPNPLARGYCAALMVLRTIG
jgi:hypothetical protein